MLTASEMQAVLPGSSFPGTASGSQLVPSATGAVLLRCVRADVCRANCWIPELLQRSSFALGLGNHLSGTLRSPASKASVFFSRCRGSKPAVDSDGHVLVVLKGMGGVGEKLLLAALKMCVGD